MAAIFQSQFNGECLFFIFDNATPLMLLIFCIMAVQVIPCPWQYNCVYVLVQSCVFDRDHVFVSLISEDNFPCLIAMSSIDNFTLYAWIVVFVASLQKWSLRFLGQCLPAAETYKIFVTEYSLEFSALNRKYLEDNLELSTRDRKHPKDMYRLRNWSQILFIYRWQYEVSNHQKQDMM